MDHQFNTGNWSMVPNIPDFANTNTPSNQDQLLLHQQKLHIQQQLLRHQHQQQPQSHPNFQLPQQQSQRVHLQQQHQPLQTPPSPSNQDQLALLHQQKIQIHYQPQPQSHSNFQLPQQQQQQQQRVHHQQQQQQHQSLASHFHLLPLIENLAHTVETGTRDPQSEALINELGNHFEKCQQLLNSIAGSINTKVMTVEGQKHKLEDAESFLRQRKDLISKYRSSIEDLTKSEP